MDESMALFCARTDHAADDLTALVRAAQADPVAFGALYDHYVERVYAYLRARTSGVDEAWTGWPHWRSGHSGSVGNTCKGGADRRNSQ